MASLQAIPQPQKLTKREVIEYLGKSKRTVETLISHPATMTHAGIGAKARKQIGITDAGVELAKRFRMAGQRHIVLEHLVEKSREYSI